MESEELPVRVGQDADGAACVMDLAALAPLLLIGPGTCGQQCAWMNERLLFGLAQRFRPDEVRILLVDVAGGLTENQGQIVELPHLVAPVATGIKSAILALRWAAGEVRRRQRRHETSSVAEPLPRLVVAVEGLTPLFLNAEKEVAPLIADLVLPMARAVGVHLVCSAAVCSMAVRAAVCGVQKYFASRLLFGGVEDLSGDLPAKVDAVPLQRAETEMRLTVGVAPPRVLHFKRLAAQTRDNLRQRIVSLNLPQTFDAQLAGWLAAAVPGDDVPCATNFAMIPMCDGLLSHMMRMRQAGRFCSSDPRLAPPPSAGKNDRRDLYMEAVVLVRTTNRASIAHLQRRLGIGSNEAARLIDQLEERGIVGPKRPEWPTRDVLVGVAK